MKFNLTPVQIIGLVLVINGALIGSTAQLTDLFGPVAVKYIIAIASIGNSIFGGIITMVTGQGSQIRNVLAMPGVEKISVNGQASPALATLAVDPAQDKIAPTTAAMDKVTATAAKAVILLAVLLTGMITFTADARAQGKLTGNLAKDIAAATSRPATATTTAASTDSAIGSFGDSVRKITKELVDKAIADVTAASADAEKHNDLISKPCWDANLKLLQGLPSQWENPPADIGIALGIQIQRDLLNSITGNDTTSLKVACAALWGDQLKIVANVGALIGMRIATGGLF